MRSANDEATLQRKAQECFKKHRAFVFKTHGDIYSRVGIPDLVACVPVRAKELKNMLGPMPDDFEVGIFVSAEMKRPGHLKDVSEAQKIVGQEIRSAGGFWEPIDNIEDLEEYIKIIQMKGL